LSQFTLHSSESRTPDNDVFKHLASVYSLNHLTMHLGHPCPDGSNTGFVNGTTNGAQWYPLTGGMQDYNYIRASCLEITLELSCCKYPPRQDLGRYWRENKRSLLLYLGEVHRGVKGMITDVNGNAITTATLKIKERDIAFKSSKRGEFWRILLPGVYTLVITADGYNSLEQQFTVEEGRITILNVQLTPIGLVVSNHSVSVNATHSTKPTNNRQTNAPNITTKSIGLTGDKHIYVTIPSVTDGQEKFANLLESKQWMYNNAVDNCVNALLICHQSIRGGGTLRPPSLLSSLNNNNNALLISSPAISSSSQPSKLQFSSSVSPPAIGFSSLLRPNHTITLASDPLAPHQYSWPTWPSRRGQANAQAVTSDLTNTAPISNLFSSLSNRINSWTTNWG
ncbi:unnamed protein product, partial [Medioppia subpectinata]